MGLREHQQRDVFSVILDCPHCPLNKPFANRCQLLNHLKSHGVTPTVDSLRSVLTFGGLPEGREFHDYSIVIPTRHPGHVPTAPTTIIPSQLDVTKTELQKTGIFLRGERQYKIIPVSNAQKTPLSPATPRMTTPGTTPTKSLPENPDSKYSDDFFCSACGSDFTDGAEFMDHVKISNLSSTELNVCTIDGVPTRSPCERRLHARIFHEKEPPFLCLECGLEFKDFDALIAHDNAECCHLYKAVIYSCNFKDMKNPSTGAHSCGSKGKFTKTNPLIKHLEQHSRNIHKCSSCPQALLSADLLQKHVTANHPDAPMGAGLNFVQCLICNVIFFTRALFQEHFLSKLREHSETTVGLHCAKCSKTFEDAKECSSHACTCKADPGPSYSTLPDKDRMSSLRKPIRTSAMASSEVAKQTSNPSGPRCVYCKVSFPSTRTLKRHQPSCDLKTTVQRKPETLVRAIRAYPHACTLCDKALPDKDEALAHYQAHHEKSTNRFKCATCGDHFDSVPELTEHKTTAHAAPAAVRSMPLKNGTGNSNRNRVVRPAFSYSYQCKYCVERKFQTRPGLRKHLRNHHGDIDFTVVDWNEMRRITRNTTTTTGTVKTQDSNANVRRSQRDRRSSALHRTAPPTIIGTHLHSGTKDSSVEDTPARTARTLDGKFQCLKCTNETGMSAVVLRSERSFYQHVREVHIWNEAEPQIIESGDEHLETTDEPRKAPDQSFWCPECSLEFVAKPSFRMHLQFAHPFIKNVNEYMDQIGYGKEKPLQENQCSVCRKKCDSTSDYEGHIRTHGMAFLRQRLQRPSI